MARHRLHFVKEGRAVYLSHLDLMRTMQRVFVRAGIKIRHTEGFNPHPYISVALPLSVGVESCVEFLDFELVDDTPLATLPARLTEKMPQGVRVLDAYEAVRKVKEITWLGHTGVFAYDGEPDTEEMARALTGFFNQKELFVKKRNKKKEETKVDIIPLIREIRFTPRESREITIETVIAAQNPSLNPGLLVEALRQKAAELTPGFAVFSRQEAFDSCGLVFR